MVKIFERNMSEELEEYDSRLPVDDFYVFSSPQIDDFYRPSRPLAPLVKNYTKSTVLRQGKTNVLSVEPRKYTSIQMVVGARQTYGSQTCLSPLLTF